MTSLRSRDVVVAATVDRTLARRFLLWLSLAVVAVRATYVLQPLRNDEGGYLLVARQWYSGGEYLYGDFFVDRPPLLMLIFKVAALTEWDPAIRVIAIPFALLFVVSAWRAGLLLGGASGARWAAAVGAALMCSPSLAADQADGGLFAAVLVMTSVALALSAWHSVSSARRLWLAAAAGLSAAAAPLAKQNFLEGLLFIGVLVIAASWQQRGAGPREVTLALGGLIGALLPPALVWVWAARSGIELGSIWHELGAFRGAAFEVIWANNPDASIIRGVTLLALGLVTGVLGVTAVWLVHARPWLPRCSPEQYAVSAIMVFGLAAIAAGGSYWLHYLIQLAPVTALAAGAVTPTASLAGRWMRGCSRAVMGAAVAGSIVIGVVYLTVPWVWFQQRTGEWLADSHAPGDTVFVAYGNGSVLEAANMRSPYPHIWSLPMRTLDPDQQHLRDTLAAPEAPSWIVQISSFNSWHIDDDARLRDLVKSRYRVVAEICGNPVWLREDLERDLAPRPPCSAVSTGPLRTGG